MSIPQRFAQAFGGLLSVRRWLIATWILSGLITPRVVAETSVSQTGADGMTPLHWAVHRGDAQGARELIDQGADADVKTLYDVTPLSIACTNGDERITRLLLMAGADANAELPGGETPLMIASRTGNPKVVGLLIEHAARVDASERRGQTALMWAAAAGNADVIDELIRAGADIHVKLKSGFTALLFAARQGHLEAARRLVAAGADIDEVMKPSKTSGRNPRDGMSAVMLAVESGHFELALWLVRQGADPNDQRSGFTALHALTWVRKADRGDNVEGDPSPRGSGDVHSLDFVRQMVDAGADVNLTLRKGSAGRAKLNRRGATAFLMASKTADLPLLKLLFQLGADPTIPNVDGCTALMAAAGIGVVAVGEEAGTEPEVLATIDWLVELGLDPNVTDKNGETAMHGAAYRNYPLAVARLARHGAKPAIWNRKNTYGWTPQMIAAGQRPGSFKPSPETIAALTQALESPTDADAAETNASVQPDTQSDPFRRRR